MTLAEPVCGQELPPKLAGHLQSRQVAQTRSLNALSASAAKIRRVPTEGLLQHWWGGGGNEGRRDELRHPHSDLFARRPPFDFAQGRSRLCFAHDQHQRHGRVAAALQVLWGSALDKRRGHAD